MLSSFAEAAAALRVPLAARTSLRRSSPPAMLLDGELARFRAHAPSGVDIDAYVRRALAKHRFRLPHRDRFPELLGKLGLNRTADAECEYMGFAGCMGGGSVAKTDDHADDHVAAASQDGGWIASTPRGGRVDAAGISRRRRGVDASSPRGGRADAAGRTR